MKKFHHPVVIRTVDLIGISVSFLIFTAKSWKMSVKYIIIIFSVTISQCHSNTETNNSFHPLYQYSNREESVLRNSFIIAIYELQSIEKTNKSMINIQESTPNSYSVFWEKFGLLVHFLNQD